MRTKREFLIKIPLHRGKIRLNPRNKVSKIRLLSKKRTKSIN